MPVSAQIKLDRSFEKQARGVFEKYVFDVGVLNDSPHRNARSKSAGLKSVAGGPARKAGARTSGKSIAQVSEDLRHRLGLNFYTQPFRSKRNADILRFTKSFFDLCAGRSVKQRCENLLQAIVRNPILRGDYGRNSARTAKLKGFNRLLIDTAQLFKNIRATVRVKRVS